jgi:hypothetical protein
LVGIHSSAFCTL